MISQPKMGLEVSFEKKVCLVSRPNVGLTVRVKKMFFFLSYVFLVGVTYDKLDTS